MRRAVSWMVFGVVLLPLAVLAQDEHEPQLLPPHDLLQPTFWEQHGWQVVLAALAAVVVLTLVILLLLRPRPIIVEPPAIIARRALEKLRGRAEDGALAMEVSRILKRFIQAVLDLPLDELTTAEFRDALKGLPQISAELKDEIVSFFRRCDEWKFSPAPPAQQLNAVARALEFVEKVESARLAFAAQPALRTAEAVSS